MTPAAMLLYILLGVGLDRLWQNRYEVFDALMVALDRLCTDPEPGDGWVVAEPPCGVTVLRPRAGGDDDGPGVAA